MLLQANAIGALGHLKEPIVFDHFETFAYSQWDPLGVATAVGKHSWFVYGLDPAPHGRGGRRSPAQQRQSPRRPSLWR